MNTDEKIKKMDLWIKVLFVMSHVMIGILLSTFVWGETDKNGMFIGLASDVTVVSVVTLGLIVLGMMLIIFRGLYLRVTQYAGEDTR